MADIQIVIGNKNTSSWSLRGWLALKATGAAFEEINVRLSRAETKAEIARHGAPTVPILKHKGTLVWETLAICEFLAETYPAAGLWPRAAEARALARSVAAEMHAGFAPLRANMPMDMRARKPGTGLVDGVQANIERIAALWRQCRERYGAGGPFLFGSFGAADAMFAPVVSRFVTYAPKLDATASAYRDAVWSWPAMREWNAAAEREA